MTCLKPIQRWGRVGQRYERQAQFYTDILTFGWDNFEHEIVSSDLTKKEAEAIEIELIKQYDTRNPERGYNKNCGERDKEGNPVVKKYHYDRRKSKGD